MFSFHTGMNNRGDAVGRHCTISKYARLDTDDLAGAVLHLRGWEGELGVRAERIPLVDALDLDVIPTDPVGDRCAVGAVRVRVRGRVSRLQEALPQQVTVQPRVGGPCMSARQAAAEFVARVARLRPCLELAEHLVLRSYREGAQPVFGVLAGTVCRHWSALGERHAARTLEAAKGRVVTAGGGGARPIVLAASRDERRDEQQGKHRPLHHVSQRPVQRGTPRLALLPSGR